MQLPEVQYPGKVILVNSAAKAKSALRYLNSQKQVGFDTETRPSFQKNLRYKVSLVQISTLHGECFLFRLKEIGSLDGLFKFFENPDVQKIGLSLKDDFHSLQRLMDFTPAGFVELQTFVKPFRIADNSLQKIYGVIFNERISKNQRLTNWEAKELTPGQQAYAALDAWACQKIYNHLVAGGFDPDSCPYMIDDETAQALQRSVGIHMHLLPDGTPDLTAPCGPDINAPLESKKKKRKKKKKEEEPAAAPAPVAAVPESPAQTAPAEEVTAPEPKKKSRYKTHSEEIAELKERMGVMEAMLAEISSRLAALTNRQQRGRRSRQ